MNNNKKRNPWAWIPTLYFAEGQQRPDRVMKGADETVVVDFKFGKPHEEYFDQVREYMKLLGAMGHQNVKGYLWYVYPNKVVEVK